jgi:hypothetical protein
MPAALPTESALDKAVQEFGIGTYDFPESGFDHGEDSEDPPSEMHPHGKSLPDDGGSLDPFGPDRLLSYPTTYSSVQIQAVGELPGDYDIPPTSPRLNDDTLQSVVHSVSQTELPNDADNPPARSDYYDNMTTGMMGGTEPAENIWADEDTGAYASEEADSLPSVNKNDVNADDTLGALGNYWSGSILEDISGDPYGSPATDLVENADWERSNQDDGGRLMASRGFKMKRQATDVPLVMKLTTDFLKEYGKKDLTHRHVLAFLQKLGKPQYLASDIVRCLKLSHSIYVKDVLEEFPIAKTASVKISSLDDLSDKIVDLAMLYKRDPEAVRELQACVADISRAAGLYAKVQSG